MAHLRSRRLVLVASVLALVAGSACKKKPPVEEAKKDVVKKPEIVEAPLPEGAVVELVVKDPEAFVKKVSTGAGLEPLVGASPYQKLVDAITDENAKKAVKALDPHGTLAVVALYQIGKPGEKAHAVAAARLKDPDVASAALEAATKAGSDVKSWDSKVLGGKAFEVNGGGEVAVVGDAVVVADARDALEAGARYVAWRSLKSSVDHELVVRMPLDKVGPSLQKVGTAEYAKVKPTDIPPKVKAELDPLVEPVLGAVGDMGQAVITMDVVGDDLKVDESIGAKGALAGWLAKWPTGDAAPILTMPQAESVSLYRLPDGLGPLTYALLDEGIDGAPLSTAERAEASKQVRALGKSFGRVVGAAIDKGKAAAATAGPPSINTEVYLRIDLDDAAGAKAAIAAMHKVLEKALPGGKKPTITPYKKNGAEGEVVATAATMPGMGGMGGGSTKDSWTWAIKGSQLHLDLCLGCTPALVDVATEGKATLGDDAAAKAKIGEMPTKGLATASYATALSLPGLGGGMGAFMGGHGHDHEHEKAAAGAMWGYSVAGEKGLSGKGTVPLKMVGDFAKTLVAIASMGMMGGPMGGAMGGPPPF